MGTTTSTTEPGGAIDQENGGVDDDRLARVARYGFMAKGFVYIVIGLLAGRMALGSGGGQASQSGAIDALSKQPFGALLVGATAVGLFAYAAYRWLLLWTGPDHDSSMPDWFARVTFAIRGAIYTGFGVLAVKEMLGGSGGGGNGGATATEKLLRWPAGAWIVGAVGVGVIVVGIAQLVYAVRMEWQERLDELGMEDGERRWTHRIGQVGHTGRALAYGLSGWFVVQAAVTHDPQKGGGLDVALREVRDAPWGSFVLGSIAVALLAYGIFSFQEGRHRDL